VHVRLFYLRPRQRSPRRTQKNQSPTSSSIDLVAYTDATVVSLNHFPATSTARHPSFQRTEITRRFLRSAITRIAINFFTLLLKNFRFFP
jgi:hypothetical protein